MKLSLLQLNINADNFWDNLIAFLTSHDFDILQLQEVTGKDAHSGNIHSKRDGFLELNKLLGEKYSSELAITQTYDSNPDAYIGNATFYKKDFILLNKNVLTLHTRTTPFPSKAKSFENAGRNVLRLLLEIADKKISFLNTHLAWAKTTQEQPHQTQQGKILIDYLRDVSSPFVLTGDFNLDPEQPIIQTINSFARNLTTENHIMTTLNPRIHKAKILFPPGAAVDYIFVSNDITVNKFEVLDKEDLSDHLGLKMKIEI